MKSGNYISTGCLRDLSRNLQSAYEKEEADNISLMILEDITGKERSFLLAGNQLLLNEEDAARLSSMIRRIMEHEPVQYVLGYQHFYNRVYKVDPRALIPRPETEELVHLVVKENQGFNGDILDIGTGSGCIPITLAKELPGSRIYAVDVEKDALTLAGENALAHGAEIEFSRLDILKSIPEKSFDIVISNPPYITPEEQKHLTANVKDYEPPKALFSTNGVQFYQRFSEIFAEIINPGGKFYLELNEFHAGSINSLFTSPQFEHVRLLEDINGKPRFLTGKTKL